MLKKLLIYLAALAGSVLFFLLFTLIFMNGIQIHCDRQADQTYDCQHQTLLLGRFPTFSKEIDHVVDATLVDDGCSDGCSYRTEFITSDGRQVPLNEVYTDRNPVSIQTNDLKSLLHSGQDNFDYEVPPLWWVLYLLIGLFLMDIIILTLTLGLGAVKDYFAQRDQLPS